MTIKEAIDGARKIVLKIGSNTLVHSDGSINTEFLTKFADDCAGLINNYIGGHHRFFGSTGNRSCNNKRLGTQARCSLQTGTLRHRTG